MSVVSGILLACPAGAGGQKNAAAYDYSAVVTSLVELHRQANKTFPSHLRQKGPVWKGNEFDPARYFTVLKHIAPPDGHVLDYAYPDVGDRQPHLYWREDAKPRHQTWKEYEEAIGQKGPAWKGNEELAGRLRLDGTPESFFEMVVFVELAGQFYLTWHANYFDTQVVSSQKDVEQIIAWLEGSGFVKLSAEQKVEARKLDVAPSVKFVGKDEVDVSVVVFTKWGGFSRITRRISREYPHTIIRTQTENLVEYHCGVLF